MTLTLPCPACGSRRVIPGCGWWHLEQCGGCGHRWPTPAGLAQLDRLIAEARDVLAVDPDDNVVRSGLVSAVLWRDRITDYRNMP